MKKTLAVLTIAILVLGWNFMFSPDKKIELTDQAKVLQGLAQAIKYKLAVNQYWEKTGKLPDAEAWQKLSDKPWVDMSQSLVTAIRVAEQGPGTITVYFSNKDVINVAADINGQTITLKPYIINQRIDWSCQGDMNRELMPDACSSVSIKKAESSNE